MLAMWIKKIKRNFCLKNFPGTRGQGMEVFAVVPAAVSLSALQNEVV